MTTTPEPGEPEETPRDLDAAFDAIVAGIRHGERPPEVPLWPAAEDDGTTRRSEPETDEAEQSPPTLGSQWSGWEDVAVPATDAPELHDPADHEHYVPPPPPPVPRGDRTIRWAWAGAVGAPVMALLLALIGWEFSGLIGLLLVAAFLTGFVALISRMREGPRTDDGPDDGAVV